MAASAGAAASWKAIVLAPVTLIPASNNTVLTATMASDLIFMRDVLLIWKLPYLDHSQWPFGPEKYQDWIKILYGMYKSA
jgi:hypothetical protein